MVKHGALSKSHVYQLLRSNDARVRCAAFTLIERSNPRLRTDSELFVEIARFIWDANPSYDLYREFTKRHFEAGYRVHELISARIKTENKPNKALQRTIQARTHLVMRVDFSGDCFEVGLPIATAKAILCCDRITTTRVKTTRRPRGAAREKPPFLSIPRIDRPPLSSKAA